MIGETKLVEILSKVTTLTMVLLKKGLRNVWIRGTKPLKPDQGRLVGRAFTLRFVPARDSRILVVPALDPGRHRVAQRVSLLTGSIILAAKLAPGLPPKARPRCRTM